MNLNSKENQSFLNVHFAKKMQECSSENVAGDKYFVANMTLQLLLSMDNKDCSIDDVCDKFDNLYSKMLEKLNINEMSKVTPLYKVSGIDLEKTVTDNYVVCLEDGKKLKMLKRHLKTYYNMTPEEYKIKWGLPMDYTIICKNLTNKRREVAIKMADRKAKKRQQLAEAV